MRWALRTFRSCLWTVAFATPSIIPLLVSKPMCWMLLLRHSTTMILMIFRVVGIPILRRLAPAGGYIHYVQGQNIETNDTRQETVNGIKYDVYSGTGWNIACTQNGVISALKCYGTNYGLVDGMEIVFDVSPYEIYYPAA